MGVNSIGLEIGGTGISIGGGGDSTSSRNYKHRRRHAIEDITRAVVAQAEGMRQAGIHPAFTGGTSAGASPVIPLGNTRGNDVSVRSGKQISAKESALLDAQIALTNKQVDEIQERIDSSVAARTRQAANAIPSMMEDIGPITITGMKGIQQEAERLAHPSHRDIRQRVSSKGKTQYYPGGTPADQDEKELGDWALITQIPRVIKYFQMNNIIPSKKDIEHVLKNPYLLQQKPAKAARKKRYPRSYR